MRRGGAACHVRSAAAAGRRGGACYRRHHVGPASGRCPASGGRGGPVGAALARSRRRPPATGPRRAAPHIPPSRSACLWNSTRRAASRDVLVPPPPPPPSIAWGRGGASVAVEHVVLDAGAPRGSRQRTSASAAMPVARRGRAASASAAAQFRAPLVPRSARRRRRRAPRDVARAHAAGGPGRAPCRPRSRGPAGETPPNNAGRDILGLAAARRSTSPEAYRAFPATTPPDASRWNHLINEMP